MPAANLKTAGKKKPTVNAAATARVGYFFRGSEAIMNENHDPINGSSIVMAGLLQIGESK